MSDYENAIKLMAERYGKDDILAITTMDGNRPFTRMVDAYYEDGAYYAVTHALSKKMKQIEASPEVAVCGIWFSGHGTGENLGHVLDERNKEIMTKLHEVFEWLKSDHFNESDPNTCILRVRLSDGILIDHEKKYDVFQYMLDFTNKTTECQKSW